ANPTRTAPNSTTPKIVMKIPERFCLCSTAVVFLFVTRSDFRFNVVHRFEPNLSLGRIIVGCTPSQRTDSYQPALHQSLLTVRARTAPINTKNCPGAFGRIPAISVPLPATPYLTTISPNLPVESGTRGTSTALRLRSSLLAYHTPPFLFST